MSEAKQTVILCEGFRDRAFWKGWLGRLGCRDQRVDPFGNMVSSGQFGFDTPGRRFVRIAPGQGDDKVLDLIAPFLKERTTKPIDWLVVNLDCDAPDDDAGGHRERRAQSVCDRFKKAQGTMHTTASGRYALDDGTNLAVLLWEAGNPPDAELPSKQTLERLVCAALREIHPARAAAVAAWLRARPAPEEEGCERFGEKAFAWSYMAGWYSTYECDEFYQRMWRVDAVARALEARLRSLGAWDLVTSVIGG